MRVLYFSQDYCPHDHRMLTAILKGGHEAYYLRLEDSGRKLENRPVPEGTHIIPWKGGGKKFHRIQAMGVALEMKEILLKVKPDLVHAGPIQNVGLVAVLSGFHPLISMSWGFDLMQDAGRSIANRWITRNVLQRSDWLFGDCRAVLDKAAGFGYNLERSSYFPWGVDLAHFKPAASNRIRGEIGWEDMTVLFCNRSWEPKYGVDIVARAFVKAAAQDDRLRLLLAGSGSQAEVIKAILQSGGVMDRVHFAGHLVNTDLPEWYGTADLYISASHTDGSSVSLMEALACGIPAAVSDITSNREWVNSGEEGWLFSDGSVDGLAELMVKAVSHKVDLAVMRIKARRAAEAKADWEKNRQVMMEGYMKAVSK